MDLYPFRLEASFFAAFPQYALRAILGVIESSYPAAYELAHKDLKFHQAHYLAPHHRRALIEDGLQEPKMEFRTAGISPKPRSNKSQNAFHVVLRGKKAFATVSCVPRYDSVVRTALFRQSYSDPQMEMFQPNEPFENPEDLTYALLLHGPAYRQPWKLGFFQVAFPGRSCKYYIHSVDLLARLKAAPAAAPTPTPVIAPAVAAEVAPATETKQPAPTMLNIPRFDDDKTKEGNE